MSRVRMATKDDRDNIVWVTLQPEYHSFLIKGAYALFDGPLSEPAILMVKRAMFVFLLEVLNQELEINFFELARGEEARHRANTEANRLKKKRSRAAKRERLREADKIARTPSDSLPTGLKKVGDVVSCGSCNKTFKSRKRLSHHKCASVTVSGSLPPKPTQGKGTLVVEIDDEEDDTDAVTQEVPTPVTAESESCSDPLPITRYVGRGVCFRMAEPIEECEDCSSYSVVLRLDRFPKCLDCAQFNHLDQAKLFGPYEWRHDIYESQWRKMLGVGAGKGQ